MRLDVDRLIRACGDESEDAGISIHAVLRPLAGPGAPVKPPIYEGPKFQEDWRWWGDPPERTRAVVVDNTPSQANRLEAALEGLREELGLPEIVLDLSGIETLPPHLPKRLSGFRFPHRQADAYLRDAELAGKPFLQTPEGAEIVAATAEEPLGLFRWFPQALLFGYWQSHLGTKRTQAKLARSWVSEIVGFVPAPADGWTHVLGLKGDPLNLSSDEPVTYRDDDLTSGWHVGKQSGQVQGGKVAKLSNVGHGQVPLAGEALAGVSFRSIEQRATVSFAGLRRIWGKDAAARAAGRALLVALGLVAHTSAFGRSFNLRSGCDLRPIAPSWRWLGADGDVELEPPTVDDAKQLFAGCRERAERAGVIDGGGWGRPPLVVTPNRELRAAIVGTWPLGV